jgi:hypothetical protein
MKHRDDSDDETDTIVADERDEYRPVNEQDRAKKEAVAAARRYLRKDARKDGGITRHAQSNIPDQTS